MFYTTTLTQKGQVTVPILFREYLGLRPYQKVVFEKRGSEILLKPAQDFLSLRGSVKKKVQFNDKKADQAVQKYIGREYVKSSRH